MTEEIGSGSYGNVFKCKLTGEFPPLYHNTPYDSCSQDDNIQQVAIKRFTSLFKCPVDTKRCLREIVQLRHLLHPNIVNIRELFIRENKNPATTLNINTNTTINPKPLQNPNSHTQHNQHNIKDVFMVMEFMDSDLRNVVKRRMTLKKKHTDSLMQHCTRALQYLHLRGVMHRDIKPNNILINEDCQAKLCDFGLARAVGANVYHNYNEQMVQQQTKKSMMDDMQSSPEHNDSISTNTHSRSPQDLDDIGVDGAMSGNVNVYSQSKTQTQSQVKGLTSSQMGWNANKQQSDMTDFLRNQNTTGYTCNVDSKAMVDTKMNTFVDTKAMVDVTPNPSHLTHHNLNLNPNLNQNLNVTYNQKDNFLNLNNNPTKNNPNPSNTLNSIYKLTPQVATRYQRAPELIIHNSYQDGRIDVWALGCVFAELLCLSNESTKHKCPVFPGNLSGNNYGQSIETIKHNLPCLSDWDRFNEKQKFNYEQLQRIFKLCGIPEDLKFIENTVWVDFFTQIKPHVQFEGLASQFAPTVSSDDIAFLQMMLTVDPYKRATIHDIVDHQWFKSLISDPRFEKYERICFVVNKNAKLLDCNQTDDQKTQSVGELNSLFWNEQDESQRMINANGDIHQEWSFQKERLNKANVN